MKLLGFVAGCSLVVWGSLIGAHHEAWAMIMVIAGAGTATHFAQPRRTGL